MCPGDRTFPGGMLHGKNPGSVACAPSMGLAGFAGAARLYGGQWLLSSNRDPGVGSVASPWAALMGA